MRYGHKAGRIATHQCCAGGTWYIEVTEDEMRKTLGTLTFLIVIIIIIIMTAAVEC